MTDKPCADPSRNGDDWFISKDGKQYSDEDLLTEAQADNIRSLFDLADPLYVEKVDATLEAAEADAKKDALRRRRYAKDSCHVECYFRLFCLDKALQDQPAHGTWGGYYEEELKVLYDKMNARARRAAGL